MIRDSGFYKLDNEELLYGPNFILNTNFNLYKEQKDAYTYPIDGWYWFDDENQARTFFGLSLAVEDPPIPGLE